MSPSHGNCCANGLVRPPGVKEKFDLLPAEKEIEGGPALCIYLDKAVKKGTFATTKKKKTTATADRPEGKAGAGQK
ncbi:MAG TPA: hypothetical protein VD969_17680 [Symbiobacteriaceae bacterium]|nr:hypothetical protein [Symbiobacteriaceae bacterium]